MKKIISWIMLMLIMMSLPMMMACGDDNEGESNSSNSVVGWYIEENARNYMIDNLNSNVSGKEYIEIDNQGIIRMFSAVWGEPFVLHNISSDFYFFYDVINIVDRNTLIKYSGSLYQSGASAASEKTVLYYLNWKSYRLALYANSSMYYTYWIEGNKLYTDEPAIYTITSLGLIPDGTGKLYTKYNHDTVY